MHGLGRAGGFSVIMSSDPTIKGIAPTSVKYDGSPLRIGVVHARWNKLVIDALLEGTLNKLKQMGVKDTNIVVESVPGSFELPLAVSRFVSDFVGARNSYIGRVIGAA